MIVCYVSMRKMVASAPHSLSRMISDGISAVELYKMLAVWLTIHGIN